MPVTERALCPVLIGREEELALLEDGLLNAIRGEGQLILLAGEAGVGKTRLAGEVKRQAEKIGAAVLWGGCSEAELALPYLPLVEAIGNWLSEQDVGSVREVLASHISDLEQFFPQLGEGKPPTPGDPQAKTRLFESLLAVLHLASEPRGALLVIEDLHWSDASTRELLDYMTRRLRGSPLLVLGTYRQDEMHRRHPLLPIVQSWNRSRLARVIELEALQPERVADMVRAIFSSPDVGDEFGSFLFERTEGNPFVVEEMLKEALDRGEIYRSEKGWELKPLDRLSIPRSLAEGILVRLERLDPMHTEILRAASVLGQAFDYALLVKVSQASESDVQAALKQSVEQQLVAQAPDEQGRYRFRHALTREAIYDDLILPRRQQLHSLAADALPEGASSAERAHHLFAAGRSQDAIPICLLAAEEANRRAAYKEAVGLYERALAGLSEQVERGRVMCEIGRNLWADLGSESAVHYLEDGIEALEKAGLVAEAAERRLDLGRAYWDLLQYGRARTEYERARNELAKHGASAALATATLQIAAQYNFNVEPEKALPLLEQVRKIAEQIDSVHIELWAMMVEATAVAFSGRSREAADMYERCAERAIQEGDLILAVTSLFNAGQVAVDGLEASRIQGYLLRQREFSQSSWNEFNADFSGAIASLVLGRSVAFSVAGLERSIVRTDEAGMATQSSWARPWLVRAYVEADRLQDAERLLTHELAGLLRQDLVDIYDSHLQFLLAAGRPEEARAYAERLVRDEPWMLRFALSVPLLVTPLVHSGLIEMAEGAVSVAATIADHDRHPAILLSRGIVAAARGDLDGARVFASEAAAGFASVGYLPFEGDAHVLSARAEAMAGNQEQAAKEFERAAGIFRSAGATNRLRRLREDALVAGVDLADEEPSGTQPEIVDAGERLVTVMFADVRGYTSMTRKNAPADMHERMSAFYRWTRREIEQRGGMVDRYLGDAVMASFNVMEISLDHAQRAVEAAVAIQDRARLMDLPVGVGIAVGPAIVGRMTGGSNVDVIGETTNLAARLQAHAADGEVALSDEAYRRTSGWLEGRDVGAERRELRLKGIDGTTRAWVLKMRTSEPA